MKQSKLSRKAAIGVILGGDLLLLLLGWVLLVAPQRSAAASIAKATQVAETQIVAAQREAQQGPPKSAKQPVIRTAGLYQLAKAMPTTTDMPDVLLELDQVARASGVTVGSITPGPMTPGLTTPYSTVTIQITFTGDFYSLTDLLFRLNSLVSVRDGLLDTSGRLFSVTSVGLTPLGGGNRLTANLMVTAYVYGTSSGSAVAAAPAATPTSTDTTSTGTTNSTTTSAPADVAPKP